jgi:hypothetical protein
MRGTLLSVIIIFGISFVSSCRKVISDKRCAYDLAGQIAEYGGRDIPEIPATGHRKLTPQEKKVLFSSIRLPGCTKNYPVIEDSFDVELVRAGEFGFRVEVRPMNGD